MDRLLDCQRREESDLHRGASVEAVETQAGRQYAFCRAVPNEASHLTMPWALDVARAVVCRGALGAIDPQSQRGIWLDEHEAEAQLIGVGPRPRKLRFREHETHLATR